jgi:sugar lactone lactonase YvrE
LWSVFALRVDPNRRVLWACTSAIEQTPELEEGRRGFAGVFEYDLTTRMLIKRYVLSNRRSNHLLGDMALSRSGLIYVTDSLDRAIYRLDGAAGTFERWLDSERFASPQGIVSSPDGKYLFMADYSHGIFRVRVDNREIHLLPYPENLVILGIDGLAWYDGYLIAIQNGVRPHRVIRLDLNRNQDRIGAWKVLEANHPGFDEPTLGVVVTGPGSRESATGCTGSFYYVANSHWGAFDRQGKLRENAELTVPLVLRLPLD